MEYIVLVRKYFLIISQICGLVLYLYFIVNVSLYEISWNWTWIIPVTWILPINSLLSGVGTYILLFPLIIITISLLIPQSLGLRIASSFFSVGGIFAAINSGFFTQKGIEIYNMKMFLVTKILTLEEKQEIFKTEFIKIIDTHHKKVLDLYNYLLSHLTTEHFEIFNNKLLLLKEKLSIKVYASEVVQSLLLQFTNEKQVEKVIDYVYWTKIGLYILGAAIAILAGGLIMRWLSDNDFLMKGAKLQKDGSILAMEAHELLNSLQQTVNNLIKIVDSMGVNYLNLEKRLDESFKKALLADTDLIDKLKNTNLNVEQLSNIIRYLMEHSELFKK